MPRTSLRSAIVVLASLGLLGLPGAAGPAYAAEVCGRFDTVDINGKTYVFQNNIWGATTEQCVDVTTTSTSWRVTRSAHTNTGGTPAAYPSVFAGCHWGNCTTGSGLPLAVNAIATATSTWSVTPVAAGAWNASYDIWFNTTPSTTAAPDGAELMIWLDQRGGVSPAGSIIASNVAISGATWNLWAARFSGWQYLAYQRTTPTGSVSALDLKAFTDDAVRRGLIQPSWYLIGVEAGYEIWQGGTGLASGPFSFSATSGTPPPPPPPGGCQVTYRVTSQWQDGFVAEVSIRNNGAPVNGWTLAWSFPGDQQFTNMWNALPTQQAQQVSARNVAYNAAIPTDGSVGFGFTARYSGTNAQPAQFRLNGTVCT